MFSKFTRLGMCYFKTLESEFLECIILCRNKTFRSRTADNTDGNICVISVINGLFVLQHRQNRSQTFLGTCNHHYYACVMCYFILKASSCHKFHPMKISMAQRQHYALAFCFHLHCFQAWRHLILCSKGEDKNVMNFSKNDCHSRIDSFQCR